MALLTRINWGDAAGWAQAVFTVAAIWYAGRFAYKDQHDRRVQAMEAFSGVAREVSRAISEAAAEAELRLMGSGITPTWKERFDDLESMLKAVPVFELGATQGAGAIVSLLFLVRSMRTQMLAYAEHGAAEWIFAIRRHDSEAKSLAATIEQWRLEREHRARRWLWPIVLK